MFSQAIIIIIIYI